MDKLAEDVEEIYIIMCADPSDEAVQQALKEIDWEERKKELGIKRDIGGCAWELAGEIIKAQCSGNENEWQRMSQVFCDGDYDEEDKVSDTFLLQYNALKRILRDNE